MRVVTLDGEHPADAAVCHPQKADLRQVEWAGQVNDVRTALEAAALGRDEEARAALQRIPRRSPLSQWRLLIAGLLDWYAGRAEQAAAAWGRLDPQRRPARIAGVLLATKSALSPSETGSGKTPQERSPAVVDHLAETLDRATCQNRVSLVRTLLMERPALRELADAVKYKRQRENGAKFPERLVDWLQSWRLTHRNQEPALVSAAVQNAMALAFEQPEAEVLERLCEIFPGPPHDRKNRLFLIRYLGKFLGAEEEVQRHRQIYLQRDLPGCRELNEPTKRAVEALIHLDVARENRRTPSRGLFAFFQDPADHAEAEAAYKSAIKAYPKLGAAHREYVEFVRQSTDSYRSTKADEEARDIRLRRIMERWAKSLPEDVEPRLWLVNHYLAKEELDAAAPHVEMLERQRLQDPRVRALPWRWKIYEVMRLARHKRRVDQARQQLDEAEKIWPEWLSPAWLPFLRAALAWRAGELEDYERLRDQAQASVDRWPLLSNIMLHAAARGMHVPNKDVQTHRKTIDAMIAGGSEIDSNDLVLTGSFLWDLERTEMLYTGYRKHASKLVTLLSQRLSRPTKEWPAEQLGPAALWGAGMRFGNEPGVIQIPAAVGDAKQRDPLAAASILRVLRDLPWTPYEASRERDSFEVVKQAAESTRDAFYRHYFQSLVDDLAPLMKARRPTGRFVEDEDDDWDGEVSGGVEEQEDEEEWCDCIDCRRARGELDFDEAFSDSSDGPPELDPVAVDAIKALLDEVVGSLSPAELEEFRRTTGASGQGGRRSTSKRRKSRKNR